MLKLHSQELIQGTNQQAIVFRPCIRDHASAYAADKENAPPEGREKRKREPKQFPVAESAKEDKLQHEQPEAAPSYMHMHLGIKLHLMSVARFGELTEHLFKFARRHVHEHEDAVEPIMADRTQINLGFRNDFTRLLVQWAPYGASERRCYVQLLKDNLKRWEKVNAMLSCALDPFPERLLTKTRVAGSQAHGQPYDRFGALSSAQGFDWQH